jgi:hypothetical protein
LFANYIDISTYIELKGEEVIQMPAGCCGVDWERLRQDIDCKAEATDSGVRVTLSAKDPEKAEALKKMAESCQTLCPDCC